MSYLDLIESELGVFEIDLPAEQCILLARYCDELERWNRKINLTALTGAALVRRLVIEPVWIARKLELHGALLDIGSGNGSPAIPIRIVSGLQSCELVESRTKRAAFLRHLTLVLGLKDVRVHHARFDETTSGLACPDWVSLQAVNLSGELFEHIRRISAPSTRIVWITSANAAAPVATMATIRVPITGSDVYVFQATR